MLLADFVITITVISSERGRYQDYQLRRLCRRVPIARRTRVREHPEIFRSTGLQLTTGNS